MFVLLFISSLSFLNSYLFLVDWSLLYNISLICHTSTRTSPRSGISLPHPFHPHLSRLFQSPSLSSLSPNSKFPLVVYLQMLASMLLSPFISPSPSFSPLLSLSLSSMSASPVLLCEQIRQTHPSQFHVFLVLTDLPVYYTLGSSPSIERTQMCSFLGLHSIQALTVS